MHYVGTGEGEDGDSGANETVIFSMIISTILMLADLNTVRKAFCCEKEIQYYSGVKK